MIPRSWLFVPADDRRKIDKAWASGADAIILDLEDSVAADGKARARANAADFLKGRDNAAQAWVRINPLASTYCDDDVAAVMAGAPDGLVLPKCAGAEDVLALGDALMVIEAAHGIAPGATKVLPIATETPAALFDLGSYGALKPERLIGLTWGAEDLPAAVGAETNRAPDGGYSDLCRLARSLCLAGAAAAGAPAFETVFPAFRDMEGLAAYADQGRREGFSGMLAIHPAQIEVIHRAFTPSSAAVARARRIVDLFASNPGAGVLAMDGEMLDAPHLKLALRLLSIGKDKVGE